MPVNPSQHVPLGKTVPTVKALHQLCAEHKAQLLAVAASAASSASTAIPSSSSSDPTSVPSSAASAAGTADTEDSAEHEGGAMNMSVMGGVGAPSSSSTSGASTGTGTGNGSGCCPHCGGDSNKLNLRLKEIFKERINSFREGVYLLTGFKVKYAHCVCCFSTTVVLV